MASIEIYFYNPEGKVDPFAPLFTAKKTPVPVQKKKKKRRIPKTPLEKYDLGQLRLVGIIRSPSGNKALVEVASGKGYIVKEGTYVGVKSGKVVKIVKDSLIVEEEAEDLYGNVTINKRELKLQKPLGE